MSLTLEDIKRVAELKTDVGYKLVMAALQAHIDTVSSTLLNCPVEDETRLLAKWRAMKELQLILINTPEQFVAEIHQEVANNPDIYGVPQRHSPNRLPLNLAQEVELTRLYNEKFNSDMI